MKQKRIKRIFDRIYNGMPNPAFPIRIRYFQHKTYLCEIAAQKSFLSAKFINNPYKIQSPLLILEGFFLGNMKVCSVLKKDGKDIKEYRCFYFETEKELQTIINKYLN